MIFQLCTNVFNHLMQFERLSPDTFHRGGGSETVADDFLNLGVMAEQGADRGECSLIHSETPCRIARVVKIRALIVDDFQGFDYLTVEIRSREIVRGVGYLPGQDDSEESEDGENVAEHRKLLVLTVIREGGDSPGGCRRRLWSILPVQRYDASLLKKLVIAYPG